MTMDIPTISAHFLNHKTALPQISPPSYSPKNYKRKSIFLLLLFLRLHFVLMAGCLAAWEKTSGNLSFFMYRLFYFFYFLASLSKGTTTGVSESETVGRSWERAKKENKVTEVSPGDGFLLGVRLGASLVPY